MPQVDLMHKDILVLTALYDERLCEFVKITRVDSLAHAPVGSLDAHGNITLKNLNWWWNNRAIPSTRDDIARLTKDLGIFNPKTLLQGSFGLSLSDTYWFQRHGQNLSWGDINFFDNDFDGLLGQYTLGINGASSGLTRIETKANPSSSLGGNLKKAWITDKNGARVLLKAGRGLTSQECFNEVIASQLYSQTMNKDDYVPYKIVSYSGRVFSACPDFVDGEHDLIPASELVFNRKKRGNTSKYEWCLSAFELAGVEDATTKICRMLAYDYVLANFDRHYNNFGILRGVNDLNDVSFAPIYDSGNSLWCDKTSLLAPGDYLWDALPFAADHSIEQHPNPQKQLHLLTDWRWFSSGMFDTLPEIIKETLSRNSLFAPERIDLISTAVQKNIYDVERLATPHAYLGTCIDAMRMAGKKIDPLPFTLAKNKDQKEVDRGSHMAVAELRAEENPLAFSSLLAECNAAAPQVPANAAEIQHKKVPTDNTGER